MMESNANNYLVNHIFLPLCLPQADDYNARRNLALCDLVVDRVAAFRNLRSPNQPELWDKILWMMQNLRSFQSTDQINANIFKLSMKSMTHGDVLVVPIRAQNACVILRSDPGQVVFELFEVDPPNADIMGTIGRVIRTFPGPGISVPDETANDPAFQQELISFLINMDRDTLSDSAASTTKANSTVIEVRETADPHYITSLLTGILLGLKGSHFANIERIQKHTRNDILWKDTYKPWRRSTLWLIIRVALQTTLQRVQGDVGRAEFKEFMLFLMATIPLHGSWGELCNDTLHCMRAKLARRLRKLSVDPLDFVQDSTLRRIDAINAILKTRLRNIVESHHCQTLPWDPTQLNVPADTHLSLLQSKNYIQRRTSLGQADVTRDVNFQPKEFPRLLFALEHNFCASRVELALKQDPVVSLMDLEHFVATSLGKWVQDHLLDDSACETIAGCISLYIKVTDELYKGNPESQSIKLLTIFQMWVALDRLAAVQIPLLLDYNPEIPVRLLDPLLLRDSHLIERLRHVHEHLSTRHARAKNGSIFEDQTTHKSFAVKYFDASTDLQCLKRTIEEDAADKREQKLDELQKKDAMYNSLLEEAESEEHIYTLSAYGEERHVGKKKCRKCRLEARASGMSITVHEWPLPQDELLAKVMVFELQCPTPFRMWRDVTYMILYDLCRSSMTITGQGEPPVLLANYDQTHYLSDTNLSRSRVAYASSTKTFLKSHYHSQKVSNAYEDSICVNNGLQFHLFDMHRRRWVTDEFTDLSIDKLCTYTLSASSPYFSLQDALNIVDQSSNLAISQQAIAPLGINLHEYMAFRTLRSGAHLQWLNIVRELRTRALSFSRPEVQTLIFQAATQIGPLHDHDTPPEWHAQLRSSQFGMRLLEEIGSLLSDIEGNWLNIVALQIAILLVSQLLNFATDEAVIEKAYVTLKRCRRIASAWVKLLTTLITDTHGEATIATLRIRLCSAALTCKATYDVGIAHIDQLVHSDSDLHAFISCSILIHNNLPPTDSLEESWIRFNLARDARITYRLIPILTSLIKQSHRGLDDAIHEIWTQYEPTNAWKQLSHPNDRWLMTSSVLARDSYDRRSSVHLNLFDGTLLINGRPLQCLPASILKHPTYLRVLGSRILDIVPSDIAHMDYATRIPISGFHLYFKLDSEDLIIQAEHERKIYELIPHRTFDKDLPAHFVNEYTHWLQIFPSHNLHVHKIEFRPLDNTWSTSPNNWQLSFSHKGSILTQGNTLLIDVRSATFRKAANLLRPLEGSEHIHVTTESGTSNKLSVSLPRFKLTFFLNSFHQLESKNYRDMVIDTDQSTGTMIGLTSQLVLKRINPDLEPSHLRSVIIPFGDIKLERDQKTHQVTKAYVNLGSESPLRYFKYDVDSNLGRLLGTTLLAHFYKIYLHAATTHPLPDSLTGKTGMEEALDALRSARSQSFETLDDHELDLLYKIADIPPRRSWYPTHLKTMQLTEWGIFAPLGQHSDFYAFVKPILQHHDSLRIFKRADDDTDAKLSTSLLPSYDSHLYERSNARHCNLYPSEFACRSLSDDMIYSGRKSKNGNSRAIQIAADVSAMVQSWSCPLPTVPDLWERFQSFGTLSYTRGRRSLSYSKEYLSFSPQDDLLSLYEECCMNKTQKARYRLMVTFPALAYQSSALHDLLPTFLAFAIKPEFTQLDALRSDSTSFNLRLGASLDVERLFEMFLANKIPFEESTSYDLQRHERENAKAYRQRRRADFSSKCSSQAWDYVEKPKFIEITSNLKLQINELFEEWHRNWQLEHHLRDTQVILDKVCSGQTPAIPRSLVTVKGILHMPKDLASSHASPLYNVESLADLFTRTPPQIPLLRASLPHHSPGIHHQDSEDSSPSELESLFREFLEDEHALRQRYGQALDGSLERHNAQQDSSYAQGSPVPDLASLTLYRQDCAQHLSQVFDSITSTLSPQTGDPGQCAEQQGGIWPRITLASLLGMLSDTSAYTLPKRWRSTIVLLAQSVMRHQQAQRLVKFRLLEAYEDFWKEYHNQILVSDNHAEWSLIQIEGDFLLRPLQREVAREMMFPNPADNTLLQLNMGEGKSSVILPLVASALADQRRIVRVIVLKPLARQMFSLLVRRLTGLANRRIFYLPFSRDVKALSASVELQSLFSLCMEKRGILVAQPEHLLSFKLMGIDLAIRSDNDKASTALIRSQQWLTEHSRDILDESDEILSIKYQLIYTSGVQEPLDDHPDRWLKIQEILHCARRHACALRTMHPDGFSVEESKQHIFPVIRILDKSAGENLARQIAEDVLTREQFRLLPEDARRVAFQFVTSHGRKKDLDILVMRRLRETMIWKTLLLLRGFIGGGILQFVFGKKRWRVDYGLDLTRTLLAVPYRAKDVPTLRADFGHPDVAIALTCLSYYYGGLREEELVLCFQLLLKLDNPALEYKAWVNASDEVPELLQEIVGINMEDKVQWNTHLKPLFHRNHAVVDFYLSKVVFPKEARQFPKRLATSSWDLAEKKTNVTTGFSGTNDNRYLLPTSIKQRDPLDQLGTNAMVLGYLLQPENNTYICLPSSSRSILERIVDHQPPVRVLLDVGAQMLDMQSHEIASSWLSMTPDIEAIVFFNEQDELVVMSRDVTSEPLEVSQYSQKLDVCGVYLDDAHTRGTDLKLPTEFKAAVTLGPGLTKDRLVQGCMRMRKLGHGQSLVFLAPPEVDRAIRALARLPSDKVVRTFDIVRWVLHETCDHIQYHLAHWAQQGIEYKERHKALMAYEKNLGSPKAADYLRLAWEERDARSLEELYGRASGENKDHPAFAIDELRAHLDELGVSSIGNSGMDEEQEREVSHEMERERQVQRPRAVTPSWHQVHPDVYQLITQGAFVANSRGFVPLFSILRHLGDHPWSPNLLATYDFVKTIASSPSESTDYQRPVEWIISFKQGQKTILVVLSPYEVNQLFPCIRESKFVHLHMYAPRVMQAMESFEDLRFFCVPPLPETWTPPSATDICQLNLFAGQLYLQDYDAYMHLRMVLGLVGDETKGENGQWWESDGFVKPENRRGKMKSICKLTSSPLPFLKDVVGLRRKGMAYHSTHIGRILHGGVLTHEDFEKASKTKQKSN